MKIDCGLTLGQVAIGRRHDHLLYALSQDELLAQEPDASNAKQIALKNREEFAHHLPRSTGPR